MFVRFDHVASFIVNTDHSIMSSAAVHRVADSIRGNTIAVDTSKRLPLTFSRGALIRRCEYFSQRQLSKNSITVALGIH